jgi:hypothetical protein
VLHHFRRDILGTDTEPGPNHFAVFDEIAQDLFSRVDGDRKSNACAWLDDHRRLLAASRVERFAYAEMVAKDKDALRRGLNVWLSLWRDVLLRVAGASASLTNPDRQLDIQAVAGRFDAGPELKG